MRRAVLFIIIILFACCSLAKADEVSQLIVQLKQAQDYADAEPIWGRLIEIGSPAVNPLIDLILDKQLENAVAGESAFYAIARIGDKGATAPLINLLSDSDYFYIYPDIIKVLGALQDTSAFESIASKYEEYKNVQGRDAERIVSEAYSALKIIGNLQGLSIFRKKAEEAASEGERSSGRSSIVHLARKAAEDNNQNAIVSLQAMLDIGLKVIISLDEEYTSEKFREEIKNINWVREEVASALKKLGVEVKPEKYEYDKTPPQVSIISPQDRTTVYGKVKIVVEATDDLSGIDEVNFFLNSRESGYRLEPPYEREWDTLLYDPGDYCLQVKATDFAGNVGESEPITVTVTDVPQDTILPVTTDNYQYNGVWTNQDTNITLTATDDMSGVAYTYYSVNGGTQQEGTNIIVTQEGQWAVSYWSVDTIGNTESPKTIGVWIDKTPPDVTISTEPFILWPPNNKPAQVTINGSAADTLSGVVSKTFTLTDEYSKLTANLTDFGQVIELMAEREGNDKDGRIYTIKIVVTDKAGNSTAKETIVSVPHDMGEKK